jgi:hypothetical protein
MNLTIVALMVLLLLLIGALPTWPYSKRWGHYPSGGLGLVVLILVVPRWKNITGCLLSLIAA